MVYTAKGGSIQQMEAHNSCSLWQSNSAHNSFTGQLTWPIQPMEVQLLQSEAVYMVYTAKGGSIQQKEAQLLQSEAVCMVYTANGGSIQQKEPQLLQSEAV